MSILYWLLTVVLVIFFFCVGIYTIFGTTAIIRRQRIKVWKEKREEAYRNGFISEVEYTKYDKSLEKPPLLEQFVLKVDKNLLKRGGPLIRY